MSVPYYRAGRKNKSGYGTARDQRWNLALVPRMQNSRIIKSFHESPSPPGPSTFMKDFTAVSVATFKATTRVSPAPPVIAISPLTSKNLERKMVPLSLMKKMHLVSVYIEEPDGITFETIWYYLVVLISCRCYRSGSKGSGFEFPARTRNLCPQTSNHLNWSNVMTVRKSCRNRVFFRLLSFPVEIISALFSSPGLLPPAST
ncbi:hypothetical protein J6590_004510 [Homalodisca vitripennis]|nr:hypothetical protein J6590_004510 [Homalodisca vitripennis]